jgi:GAF domain-containing protein
MGWAETEAMVMSNVSELVLEGQTRAIELAGRGEPLRESLAVLVRTIERVSENGVIGSILLLSGKQLRLGAAPSLADDYNAAIDGLVIGPTVGSCGTAAFIRQTVVVRDIATDPLWADFKDLALSHGLRACWSTPVLGSSGEVLATFALYHREPRAPNPRDLEIAELLTRTAAMLIEREAKSRPRAGTHPA